MLTDTKLRNLKPTEKLYKVNDRDGLYVAVTTGGSISFRYNYSINGRQETITFGRYGVGGITLAETREQLGETVQELVARADVKSLARAKAAELRGRVKDTTSQARRTATAGAVSVRSQVTGKSAAALQKATSAGATQRDQLRNRAVAVGTPAWQATPKQVRRAMTNGASGAKERWVPLSLASCSLILGYLALRRWRLLRLLRTPLPGLARIDLEALDSGISSSGRGTGARGAASH